MPDEVNPTQDTSPPVQENEPAFLSAPTDEQPAAAPPPKKEAEAEYEPPSWTTQPISEPSYQPQYQPQYQTPPPQYQQQFSPPQWTPPPPQMPPPQQNITLEQFVQNPQAVFEATREQAKREALQSILPIVQEMQSVRDRVRQLDDFGRKQHENNVSGAFEQTRAAIREAGYKGIFAKDPAFKNKAVQDRVDAAVRGYLARATEQAYVYNDYSGYASAMKPSILRAILNWAKEESGWGQGGGQPVQYSGGLVEQGTAQPPQASYAIDEDLRDAARRMGVDESVLRKSIEERKRLGW